MSIDAEWTDVYLEQYRKALFPNAVGPELDAFYRTCLELKEKKKS